MVAERRSSGRPFSRMDRVNEALREVIADELERIGDERLELVTVTGIKADSDLSRARVWFDSLGESEDVAAALSSHRVALQTAINRQLRLKRTPELTFTPDPAIAVGTRVEEILRGLQHEAGEPPMTTEDGSQ